MGSSVIPRSRTGRVLTGLIALALVAAAGLWMLRSADSGHRPGAGAASAGNKMTGPGPSSTAPSSVPAVSRTAAATQAPATPTGAPTATGGASTGSLTPVPYHAVTPQPAIPLRATADFGTGLRLQVTGIDSVRSRAQRPGEISAPAIRITLQARNDSARPISLAGMVLTVDYGAHRTPAIEVAQPGGSPFEGVLPAGRTARGVYVFNVPLADRDRIRVTTSYTGSAPTLVLAGSAT